MVTNILLFVACPSELGAIMIEGRKCNIASHVVLDFIKLMVQIVSMSGSIYTLRH
jgi:hypothetical protein